MNHAPLHHLRDNLARSPLTAETCRLSLLRAGVVALLVGACFMTMAAPPANPPLPLAACQPMIEARPVDVPVKPIGMPDSLTVPTSAATVSPAPAVIGACKSKLEANKTGAAAAFWCERAAGTPPVLYLYAVRWSAITPGMTTDFAALALPGDTGEKMRQLQLKHQTANVWDMCDVWGPIREWINTSAPATKPKPPAVTLTITAINLPANGKSKPASIAWVPKPASVAVRCRLDAYAPIVCPNPFNLSAQPVGQHRVDFYNADNLTNPVKSHTWTVTP